MKVINVNELKGTEREVHCPKGAFISTRILLKSDNMGFTLTKTIIPEGDLQFWHYKKHLEACYCLSGVGKLINLVTSEKFKIEKDIVYVLDDHTPHFFKAESDVTLICVFNPPLEGKEIHKKDGSY